MEEDTRVKLSIFSQYFWTSNVLFVCLVGAPAWSVFVYSSSISHREITPLKDINQAQYLPMKN